MLILSGHKGRLRSIAFSHDGQLLASCAGNGTAVSLWDTARGKRMGFLSEHVVRVACVAFSPGPDKLLASSDIYGRIHLWDPVARKLQGSLANNGGSASCIAISPASRLLAVVLNSWSGHSIALWDSADRKARGTLTGTGGYAYALAFVPVAGFPFVLGTQRSIDWWEQDVQKVTARLRSSSPVRALACSSDG
jgi:WD40 repeat protein